MDEVQRLNLNKLASDPKFKDNTSLIRELKHSDKIKDDVDNLIKYKSQSLTKDECSRQCSFLFKNYTDIFNKVYNNELHLNLLDEFIKCLKQIENGELNQHEGSFKVGQILKTIYIDSALARANKLNKNDQEEKIEFIKPKNVTWSQYKKKF